ncbi:hypothetical protein E2562_003989, partial [Oryza meyeriana var. granulata]
RYRSPATRLRRAVPPYRRGGAEDLVALAKAQLAGPLGVLCDGWMANVSFCG